MEASLPTSKRYTLEEYFRLADASPTKLEFKSGEIIDMAGASYAHILITNHLARSLGNRLEGKPCEATSSELRVKSSGDRFCYPDVVIVCDEPKFDPRATIDTLENPSVIFEVLSPSTELADRGEKFFNYIRLPSLHEYFLVAQDRARVESFFRNSEGTWIVGPVVEGVESQLKIQSLQLEIPMSEIYAKVKFENHA